jgi:acyl-CoA reductase-like NAD-dependent aldehyde dehydrogenase
LEDGWEQTASTGLGDNRTMNACVEQTFAATDSPSAVENEAVAAWRETPVARRLEVVRELRHLIASQAVKLAAVAAQVSGRPVAEKLVSEVLPLADACRWLERRAARVLAPRRCGKSGRPFWMRGVTFEVQRRPLGVVLVIGPGNYPLFLPAVQALHALVAGNAVLLKPAPDTRNVALAFGKLLRSAGLDPALFTVLPESVEAARETMARGVDKVVFTGSSENGRDVLAELAARNTPAVMELSGEDAVLVFADADLDLVVRALRFGTRLNAGKTCMAPRRIIVAGPLRYDLLFRVTQAGIRGLSFESVPNERAAIRCAEASGFALGVSIFTRDVEKARQMASRIKCGFVTVNDLIVPTADPRMPFGGVKASGFGVTRGDEGLLEMTFPHVVAVSRGGSRPHFDEPSPGDTHLFSAYILAAHGSGRRRFGAVRDLAFALIEKSKNRRNKS